MTVDTKLLREKLRPDTIIADDEVHRLKTELDRLRADLAATLRKEEELLGALHEPDAELDRLRRLGAAVLAYEEHKENSPHGDRDLQRWQRWHKRSAELIAALDAAIAESRAASLCMITVEAARAEGERAGQAKAFEEVLDSGQGFVKLIFLVLILSGCASWRPRDTILEGSVLGLLTLDAAQTISAQHASGGKVGHEQNPFLGEHPGDGAIVLYFVSNAIVHTVVSRLITGHWRSAWQVGWVGVEGWTIVGNVGQFHGVLQD